MRQRTYRKPSQSPSRPLTLASRPFPIQAKAKASPPPGNDPAELERQAANPARPGFSFADVQVFHERQRPVETGAGRPLPEVLRKKMDRAFHADFSDVRIHQGPGPESLSARAFTQGRDIHFAPGQYNPASLAGQRIIAHELTHVVQQRQGRVAAPQNAGIPINANHSLEAEADRLGARATLSPSSNLLAQPGLTVGAPQASANSTQAPIQLTFDTEHLEQASQQHGLTIDKTLMRHIHAFNDGEPGLVGVEDARTHKALLDGQYEHLHNIEQGANAWLWENNEKAPESHRRAMYALLDQVESHHTKLVGETVKGGHELWLPSSMKHEEKEHARGIWNSIRGGRGNIQIEGGDEFRTRMLASTARLVEGKHGRQMLKELNANPSGDADRRIRIGSNWQQEFQGIPGADWREGSWARSIHATRGRGDLRHRSANAEQPGEGSGSYVQIDENSPPVAGTRDEPLHMPRYITLGHELGHAQRNLRGVGRGPGYDRPGDLSAGNQSEQQLQEKLWTSPEEHENITQQENPLRAEHGLPGRSFHKPSNIVRIERSKDGIYRRLTAANDRIPRSLDHEALNHHLPELNQAITMFHPGPAGSISDWTNQATHRQAEGLVSHVENNVGGVVQGIQEGSLLPPAAPPQVLAQAPPPPMRGPFKKFRRALRRGRR